MPARGAGIHVFFLLKTWMAGPSPAMTTILLKDALGSIRKTHKLALVNVFPAQTPVCIFRLFHKACFVFPLSSCLFKLQRGKTRIEPALGDQALMRARSNQSSAIEHQNAVGIYYRC